MQIQSKLTAVIEPCEEGGYMAFLEEMPNVCTQGESIEEAKENLNEAFQLVMQVQRDLSSEKKYHPQSVYESVQFV